MFTDLVAAAPDAPAVIDHAGRARTRAEFWDRAGRVARMLRVTYGLRPGAHAAIVSRNRTEYLEVVLGAMLAGVWITPANRHLTADELAYVLADAGAGLIVTDESLATTVATAAPDVPRLIAGDELDAALDAAPTDPIDFDGPAAGAMIYTSGTSGRPKGVRRVAPATVGDLLSAQATGGAALGLTGRGPHYLCGPMYHAAPLLYALYDLANGASVVIDDRFDATRCLEILTEHQVATTHLVPTMMNRLLRLPAATRVAFDPSRLELVLHGAAPIRRETKQAMIEWWGPVLVEYWGATEGGVYTLVDSATWLDHPGTVGRAIPTYEVFAVSADGDRLPAGETGRLFCRHRQGATAFRYHHDEAKTAAAYLTPDTFSVGDIGHVDADGLVYLTDRASNMIIRGGVNLYPAEIEAVLGAHPAVADCVVFGIPDDDLGEAVHAAIEWAGPDAAVPDSELQAWCARRLARDKVPASFEVHERLPRTEAGKLAAGPLKAPHWDLTTRRI